MLGVIKEPKISATVQVDVDGLEILLRHHGHEVGKEQDFIFLSGMPRFLELFARWDIKATFFIVGSDLENADKVALLQRLVDEGHEVGNHTVSHPSSLSYLHVDEQEEEIALCEEMCKKKLGVSPKGFRAPNFDVGENTIDILERRGYEYDSSVLAMPYGPILRWCKNQVTAVGNTRNRYLGRATFGLASLFPYPMAHQNLWQRGKRTIVEAPVTTVPFLRLPFHASFNLALRSFGMGDVLFDFGYECAWRTRTPLNYVFHLCELADLDGDRRLQKHWGLSLPINKRISMADRILKRLIQKYEVVPTCAYVKGGKLG